MSTVLECQVDPNSKASWDGPDGESDSKSVRYFDGTYMNPSLSKNKIKLIGSISHGEYNLQIRNVSARDEGVYKCFNSHIKKMKAVSTYITLTIKGKSKVFK